MGIACLYVRPVIDVVPVNAIRTSLSHLVFSSSTGWIKRCSLGYTRLLIESATLVQRP